MADIPALTSFTPGTVIRSSEVNANFAAIRNAFNNTAVLTDEVATITVNHIFNVNQTFKAGITVSGLSTFTSGVTVSGNLLTISSGLTFSTGTATFASGTSIVASGVTVAGNVVFSSIVTVNGALTVGGSLTGTTIIGNTRLSANATGSVAFPAIAITTVTGTGFLGDSTGLQGAFNQAVFMTVVSNAFSIAATTNFVVGATLTTNATLGFIYAPTSPGTSTGTPVTQTGTVALCYDTTNNRLQVFNGGWKTVLLA